MSENEKRIRDRGGIDGGSCVFRDADGNVTGFLVPDPEIEGGVIALDGDGNQVISTSIATGEDYAGVDKEWKQFTSGWKFPKEQP